MLGGDDSNKENNNELLQLSKEYLIEAIATGNDKLRKDLKKELVDEITDSIEKSIETKFSCIKEDLTSLHLDIDGLKKTSSDAYEISTDNEKKIASLDERMQMLEESSSTQSTLQEEFLQREAGYKKDIDELKKNIDDQINRSMRGNLVFLGLPEDENENYNAKDVIANFIFENLYTEADNMHINTIHSSIVRAHRGKFHSDREKKGPRPIYAKFNRDNVAALYLRKSIVKQVSKTGIRVKQQFTKSLQERIDNALKHRRELIEKKLVKKAYVEYPATLKAIRANSTSNEYTTIQTF